MVFRISIFLIALLVAAAGITPDSFNNLMQILLKEIISSSGWLYLLIVFISLIFLLYVSFGRFADLRIGGEDAEPEFGTASWLSMLFAAGMGIGLIFWGAAEPISHFNKPPEGLEPQSVAAANAAMRYSYFHWGLHPWAIYGVVGLAMAWFQYNRRGRGLISDLLQPLIGVYHRGWIGYIINILAVIVTAIGVSTTLGFGTMQIAAGVDRMTPISGGIALQLGVIAVAFVLYMASSSSGVQRGVKWLSNINLVLAILLLLLVIILGPTGRIFDTFTTTTGGYLNQLANMSLRMSPFSDNTWVADWTIFYWAWWISWAPYVGAFIARLSYGRRIREFVFGVVIVPSVFGFLWFSAFGGTALWQQIDGGIDMASILENEGYQNILYTVFDHLPISSILTWLAIILVFIFFITSADSAVLVLSGMSSDDTKDPPMRRKFIWGIAIAMISGVLLMAGGLDALQAMITVAALPFAVLLLLIIISLYKALNQEYLIQERRKQRARKLIETWIADEQQAQSEA